MKLKELVRIHVRASGPVTFTSVLHWLDEQHNGPVENYEVAAALTALIRDKHVALYDDGASFIPTN